MKNWQWLAIAAALALVGIGAFATGNIFILQLATRIVILAIAAAGVQLIVGYGNLITLGHATFVGLGVYVVAACSYFGSAFPELSWGPVQLGFLLAFAVVVGFVTGDLSLRMRGIHFLMITLAFGQMFHLAAVSATIFGGDDGMSINKRPWFPFVDLSSPLTRFTICSAVLLAVLYLVSRLIKSPFGLALRASATNEVRLASSGYDVHRIRLTAYVISAVMVSLAGYLLAIHSEFASPAAMHWSRSGDLVIMVVLGGRLVVGGPLLGATTIVLIEEVASRYTESWPIVLGVLLVALAALKSSGFQSFRMPKLWGAKVDA